ncbi:PKD domain-containing protein [Pseudoalteromonas sp. SS15]|uniref:leucine-rich repeat domain-containing protein n=1 Tax=Pseudoalteromonas sp. SS15 TaxID=3139393 RepID=UPI003BADAF56
MRMHLSRKFALSLLSTSLMLTGCGGGSDDTPDSSGGGTPPPAPENKKPTVTIEALTEAKEQVAFTLKATASDEDGSVESFSWTHDSQLDLKPENTDSESATFTVPDISEDITVGFTVTVTDDDGDTASSTQSVTIKRKVSSVTITGIVTDGPIENALVTVTAGNSTVDAQADDKGAYSITAIVDESEVDQLVTLTAKGQPDSTKAFVEFKSQLPSTNTLQNLAGDDAVLTKEESFAVNVTNVSTAEYALLQRDGGAPQNEAELENRLKGIDAQEKLELAALIKTVVDYGVELPDDVKSTLDLVTSEENAEKTKTEIQKTQPEVLEKALKDIKEDEELLEAVSGSLLGDFIINKPRAYNNRAIHLTLNGADEGATSGEAVISASQAVNTTWEVIDGVVKVDLTEDNLLLDSWTDGAKKHEKRLSSLEFSLLEDKDAFTVIEISKADVEQYENGEQKSVISSGPLLGVANLFKKSETFALDAQAWQGTWAIQSFNDNQQDDEVFVFTIDSEGNISDEDGSTLGWTLDANGQLTITYNDEGTEQVITFWLTKEWKEDEVYQAVGLDDSGKKETFYGLFVKLDDIEINEENIVGRWRVGLGHTMDDYDVNILPDLSVEAGLNRTPIVARVEDDVIHRGVYSLDGENVDFCDTSEENCTAYYRSELEILNTDDEIWFGYHQEWRANSLGELELSDAGLYIYEKTDLAYDEFEDEMLAFDATLNYFDGEKYAELSISPNADNSYSVTIDGVTYVAQLVEGTLEYTYIDGVTYRISLEGYEAGSLSVCLFDKSKGCDSDTNLLTLNTAKPSFTVETNVGENGKVTPEQAELLYDEHIALSILPDFGFAIDQVTGCNGTLQGRQYLIGELTENCQVDVSFKEADASSDGVISDLTFYNPDYYRSSVYQVTLKNDGTAILSSSNYSVDALWSEEDGAIKVSPIDELVINNSDYFPDYRSWKEVLESIEFEIVDAKAQEYEFTANITRYNSQDGQPTDVEARPSSFNTFAFNTSELGVPFPELEGKEWSLSVFDDVVAIKFAADGSAEVRSIEESETEMATWSIDENDVLTFNLEDGNQVQLVNTKDISVGLQAIAKEFDSEGRLIASGAALMVERGDIAITKDNFVGARYYAYGEAQDATSSGHIIYEDGHIGSLMYSYGGQGVFDDNGYTRYIYRDFNTYQANCDQTSASCALFYKIDYRLIAQDESRYFIERILNFYDVRGSGELRDRSAVLQTYEFTNSTKVAEFTENNVGGWLYEILPDSAVEWRFYSEYDAEQEESQFFLSLDEEETRHLELAGGKLNYYEPLEDTDYVIELVDNDQNGIVVCRYEQSFACQEDDKVALVKEKPAYEVTIESDVNGKLTDMYDSDHIYRHGDTVRFEIRPDYGFAPKAIEGCNGYRDGGDYVIDALTSDCTITASFEEFTPLSEQASITDEELAICVDKQSHERRFWALDEVTALQCDHQYNGINNLAELAVFPNLESIDLHNIDIADVDLSALTALTSVSINYSYNERFNSLTVAAPENIISLSLRGNRLNDAQLEGLKLNEYINLQHLDLDANVITKLDPSVFEQLQYLSVSHNELTSIDLSNNLDLISLWVVDNELTQIDVSNNTMLEKLGISFNDIESLDVSNNTLIDNIYAVSTGLVTVTGLENSERKWGYFEFHNNPLSDETVDELERLKQEEGFNNIHYSIAQLVTISAGENGQVNDTEVLVGQEPVSVYIQPDEGYEVASISGCDAENDQVTLLNANHLEITSVTQACTINVEFTEAVPLATKLEIPEDNVALTECLNNSNYIWKEQVKNLNCWQGIQDFSPLSKLPALHSLELQNLTVEALDLSALEHLTSLEISNNYQMPLNSITLNNAEQLTRLVIRYGTLDDIALESLNLAQFKNLKELELNDNQLTELDVSQLQQLERLSVSYNQLSKLDVSGNTELKELEVYDNALTSLDLSNNTQLHHVNANSNQLTEVTGIENITDKWAGLYFERNPFTNEAVADLEYLSDIYFNLYYSRIYKVNLKPGNDGDVQEQQVILGEGENYYTSVYANNGFQVASLSGCGIAEDRASQANILLNTSQIVLQTDTLVFDENTQSCDLTIEFGPATDLAKELGIQDEGLYTCLNYSGYIWKEQVKSLGCYGGEILDFSELANVTTLTSFEVYDVQSDALDLSKLSNLSTLRVSNSDNLTNLTLPQSEKLEVLVLNGLNLTNETLDNSGISALTNLKRLELNDNKLVKFDASSLTQLEYLSVYHNDIKELVITGNTLLEELKADNNPLVSLDTSSNAFLRQLHLQRTALTELDVSANVRLDDLIAYESSLQSVSGIEYLKNWVHINLNNTPLSEDMVAEIERLRDYEDYHNIYYSIAYPVTINTDDNGYTYDSKVFLSEDKTREVYLYANDGFEVGEITATGCDASQYELLDANRLIVGPISQACTLDVSFVEATPLSEKAGITNESLAQCVDNTNYIKAEQVKSLSCSVYNVESFAELSKFENLHTLELYDNQQSVLDLTGLANLRSLYFRYGQSPSELKLTNPELLEFLDINYAGLNDDALATLDISRFIALKELRLRGNQLTQLDTSVFTELETLDISDNQVTAVDLTSNVQLQSLYLGNNPLTELNLAENTQLLELEAYQTQLSQLDISNNHALQRVNASNAFIHTVIGIESLDINTVQGLTFDYNPLTQDMVDEFERLKGEGYYISYSLSYPVTVNFDTTQAGGSHGKYYSDGETNLDLYIYPNDGLEIGTVEGCDGQFELVDANHLIVKPITQACTLDIKFVDKVALAEKAGITSDNQPLMDCVNNSNFIKTEQVKALNCWGYDIQSFTELSAFTNLTNLELNYLTTPKVDLSSVVSLKDLTLYGRNTDLPLTTLTLANPEQLERLSLSDNQLDDAELAQLNLAQFSGLKELVLSNNDLTKFNAESFSQLEVLELNGNSLTELSVTSNSMLRELVLYINNLTGIDISQNVELVDLRISDNPITALALDANPLLKSVDAARTHLNSVTGIEVIEDTGTWLHFSETPLSDETVTEFERLRNELGYYNLHYSKAYPVVITSSSNGWVGWSNFFISPESTNTVGLYPDTNYTVTNESITGCRGEFSLEGTTLTVGPVTDICEIKVEFVAQ